MSYIAPKTQSLPTKVALEEPTPEELSQFYKFQQFLRTKPKSPVVQPRNQRTNLSLMSAQIEKDVIDFEKDIQFAKLKANGSKTVLSRPKVTNHSGDMN